MPKANKPSLSDQWTTFELTTGVALTSKLQRNEMRRAFYCGATSILNAMITSFTEDREPTQEDLDYMDSIANEIDQFGEDVHNGKA